MNWKFEDDFGINFECGTFVNLVKKNVSTGCYITMECDSCDKSLHVLFFR